MKEAKGSEEKFSFDDIMTSALNIAEKTTRLSINTRNAYKSDGQQFRDYFLSQGYGDDVRNVNAVHIEEWLATQNYDRDSLERKKYALSFFFRHCIKRGITEKNPALQVDIRKEREQTRDILLKGDQIRDFIEVEVLLKGYTLDMQRAIKASLAFTCMRRDEIRNLDWVHVDFKKKIITVYDTKNAPGMVDREIPMCDKLFAFLKKIYSNDRSAVFVNKKGDRLTSVSLGNLIERSQVKVGIVLKTNPNFKQHDRRPTRKDRGILTAIDFRSNLSSWVEKTGSKSDARFLLGHRPFDVSDVYSKSSLERVRTVLNMVAELIWQGHDIETEIGNPKDLESAASDMVGYINGEQNKMMKDGNGSVTIINNFVFGQNFEENLNIMRTVLKEQ